MTRAVDYWQGPLVTVTITMTGPDAGDAESAGHRRPGGETIRIWILEFVTGMASLS